MATLVEPANVRGRKYSNEEAKSMGFFSYSFYFSVEPIFEQKRAVNSKLNVIVLFKEEKENCLGGLP